MSGLRRSCRSVSSSGISTRLLRAVFLNKTRVASELVSVFQKHSFFFSFNAEESFDLGFQMPTLFLLAERGQGPNFQRYSGIS